jgi:hypothetical protein
VKKTKTTGWNENPRKKNAPQSARRFGTRTPLSITTNAMTRTDEIINALMGKGGHIFNAPEPKKVDLENFDFGADDEDEEALDEYALFQALQKASNDKLYAALSDITPAKRNLIQTILNDMRDQHGGND